MTRSLSAPDAMRRLQDAAAAAALSSPQELLDLAADAGVTPAPPEDNLTERLTLEELGAEVAERLAEVQRDAALAWAGEEAVNRDKAISKKLDSESPTVRFFAGLAPTQQDALLVHLSNTECKSPASLAVAFGINPVRLARAIKLAIDRKGDQVIGVRLNTVVGGLVRDAERAMDGLARSGDWRAFWAVRKELTSKLEDLGIVRSEPKRVDVKHTHEVDDETRQEVQALLELERKKATRQEEIKRAQVSVIEKLPEAAT